MGSEARWKDVGAGQTSREGFPCCLSRGPSGSSWLLSVRGLTQRESSSWGFWGVRHQSGSEPGPEQHWLRRESPRNDL